jgi:hypothetical protein
MLFIYFRQWIRNKLEKHVSMLSLKIPIARSLTVYPIELKHIKTCQDE